MQTITKIVITGGPCAGKTTAMSWIQNFYTKQGYVVLFVPETATELITGGVAPWTCGTGLDFQKALVDLQLSKERIIWSAAESMSQDKILIVCDRGALDNKAYMSDAEFAQVLKFLNSSEVALRDGYDAVIHLVTAANGADKFYTLENNKARTEKPEQAIALDNKLIAAWTGHPHLRVVDNSTGFEEKMKRTLTEISNVLGEPEPYEVERKFLIRYPDTALLERLPNCDRVEIIQTYLSSDEPDTEIRIRQRGRDGSYLYYKTVKRAVSDIRRVETETRLSKDEYLNLLLQADTSLRQIRKTRYCLVHDNQYFEIDLYPFWTDQAILELELLHEDQPYKLPPFIDMIREVTNEGAYMNRALAQTLPQ